MNENKESELLSLIKYVQMNSKKKLIMNSRIAIFNEARGRSIEFNKFFNRETILNYLIDMDNVSSIDKAKFSIPISISMEFLHLTLKITTR